MSSHTPLQARLAQAAGLATSLILTGSQLSTNVLTLPTLMQTPSPTLLASQWRRLVTRLNAVTLPAHVICGLLFGYLASREHAYTHAFRFYSFAAILSPIAVPYAFLFLRPIQTRVDVVAADDVEAQKYQLGRPDDDSGTDGGRVLSVHDLVDRWGWWNLGQTGISAVAALCGLWGAVGDS